METTNLFAPGWADRHRDPVLQPRITLDPAEVNIQAIEGCLCNNAEVVSRVCRSKKVEDCEWDAVLSTKKLRFCCAL